MQVKPAKCGLEKGCVDDGLDIMENDTSNNVQGMKNA